MKHIFVIGDGPRRFDAHVPELPGCVAAGAARAEPEALIRDAVAGHLEVMREESLPISTPRSTAELPEIA